MRFLSVAADGLHRLHPGHHCILNIGAQVPLQELSHYRISPQAGSSVKQLASPTDTVHRARSGLSECVHVVLATTQQYDDPSTTTSCCIRETLVRRQQQYLAIQRYYPLHPGRPGHVVG